MAIQGQYPMQQPEMQMQGMMQAAPFYAPGMMPGMMATTEDPSLQCYFEECKYLATSRCRWENCCCRSKSRGGCNQGICTLHRYQVPAIQNQNQAICCVRCGPEIEKDIVSNKKCACYYVLFVVLGMLMLTFLPMIIILSTV